MLRFVVALLSIWCVIPMAPSAAAPSEHRRVLLLFSYEREFMGYSFAGLFRPELGRLSPDPVDFIEVSLQTARASRHEPDDAALERLRGEVAGRPFDLVITIGGPAAVFTRAHSADLFAGTPVPLASVASRSPR